MPTIERAREIATEAHAGQRDKAGADYVTHPLRVAAAVEGETRKIVALLHDVVEDNPAWPLSRLEAEGFSTDILAAVDAMTRREDEDYFDFVRRAAADPLARRVKIADLRDNSDRTRLKAPITGKDEQRLAKYQTALAMIDAAG